MHFFDGFRTSHEIQKIEELTFDDMRAMIDDNLVPGAQDEGPHTRPARHTRRLPQPRCQLSGAGDGKQILPGDAGHHAKGHGQIRGSHGQTVQALRLLRCARRRKGDRGHGLGGETALTTLDAQNGRGEKLGLIQVALYRPFDSDAFAAAVPATVKAMAVLDRTKEPGAMGEPLYLDIRAALNEAEDRGLARWGRTPRVVGGRYGLGSKDFTPAMAKAVYDNLAKVRRRTTSPSGSTTT